MANGAQAGPGRPVAAIDIGSNAVRLAVAQVRADGTTEVLEHLERAVHLGQDTFVKGRLDQETMNATLSVLRAFRQTLESYGVERVWAVATNAVREAANCDAFVDRVAMTVGFDVEVIEPMEQSRLVISAVLHEMGRMLDLHRRAALVAEVGGGSTLATVLRHGQIASAQSVNLGAVRMQETLATRQYAPERAADLLRRHIGNSVALVRRAMGLARLRTFIAVGGDARFAAQHAGAPFGETPLRAVSREALAALIAQCAPCAVEELVRRFGISHAAAETLVPALLVNQALLAATRADWMVVSQASMRDGMLLDLPRVLAQEGVAYQAETVVQAARSVGEKYRCDGPHAQHVAQLAVRLFDATQGLHRLTPRHRLLLEIAALLHDIGAFVSTRSHHKHSYYLVANSEVFGLRREDLATVAHVARYHRRSMPKTSHLDYVALPREQRLAVNKLAALLRVADALDHSHSQQVRGFDVELQERDLVLHVQADRDLTLERLAMPKKADMFQEVFGLSVRVEEDAGWPAPPAGKT